MTSFVETTVLSSMDDLGNFVENHLTIYTRVCLRAFYSISLVSMLVPHYFDYYGSVVSFEIKKCATSNFVLLFQDWFDFLGIP